MDGIGGNATPPAIPLNQERDGRPTGTTRSNWFSRRKVCATMADAFDPYHRWLGIPRSEQPCDFYRLLGVPTLEDDLEAIASAAERQIAFVGTHRKGQHGEVAERVLKELQQARKVLLDPKLRPAYEAKIKKHLAKKEAEASSSSTSQSTSKSGAASKSAAASKSGAGQAPPPGPKPIAKAAGTPPPKTKGPRPVAPQAKPVATDEAPAVGAPVLVSNSSSVVRRRKNPLPTIMILGSAALLLGGVLYVLFSAQAPGPAVANPTPPPTEPAEDPVADPEPVRDESVRPNFGGRDEQPANPDAQPNPAGDPSSTAPPANNPPNDSPETTPVSVPPEAMPGDERPRPQPSGPRGAEALAPLLARMASQAAAHGEVATEAVGSRGGDQAVSKSGQGLLAGLGFATAERFGQPVITGVRTVYLTANGHEEGDLLGPGEPEEAMVAREGYAVGELHVAGGNYVQAVRIKFQRLTPEGLDPDDGYLSEWSSGSEPESFRVLGGGGDPLVGIQASFTSQMMLLSALAVPIAAPPPPEAMPLADAPTDRPGSTDNGSMPVRTLADLLDTSTQRNRQPPPTAEEVAEARTQVDSIFEEDVRKARDNEARRQLAREIELRAQSTTDSPAAQFALWKKAAELAEQANDPLEAWRMLGEISRNFQEPLLEDKRRLLNAANSQAKTPPAQQELAEAWLDLVRESIDWNEFRQAAESLEHARRLTQRVGSDMMKARVNTLVRDVREMGTMYDRVRSAGETLETNADDVEAAATWGRFLCLYKNDWERGLPLLAKASGVIASLAEQDLGRPSDGDARVSLADGYWDLGQAESDELPKRYLMERAAYWYERALDQLSDLKRVQAERRLTEYREKTSPLPVRAWIDLLGITNPNRDRLDGRWQRNGNQLVGQPEGFGAARITLPVEINGSFELTLKYRPVAAPSGMALAVPVGDGRRVEVIINERNRGRHGLQLINETPLRENPSLQQSPVQAAPINTLELSVQTDGTTADIGARLNGRPVFTWKGPIDQMRLADERENRYSKSLILATDGLDVGFVPGRGRGGFGRGRGGGPGGIAVSAGLGFEDVRLRITNGWGRFIHD